ncbi:winged helix-turn-helix domain-containing protein [Salipiger sp. H15]|uniref:Winged helix-turn-helix domain-containing protein n=1 Tax=Alloyangia sp. H15 TaxID=3029062 RepID=A0AAU8AMY0_9RHOB
MAQTGDGRTLRFTRSEARTLALLTRSPDRIATREMLLDALTEIGSDRGERNIDFVINRLRRKLSDDARNPRYIATRYGEGYLWVGGPPAMRRDPAGADLLVGPLNGLDLLGPLRPRAEQFARRLRDVVKEDMPAGQNVILMPDAQPRAGTAGNGPSKMIELTFFAEAGAVNCVAAVKLFDTGRILSMSRITLDETPDDGHADPAALRDFVRRLLNDAWRAKAGATESDGPLPVAMYTAGFWKMNTAASATDSLAKLNAKAEANDRSYMQEWRQSERRILELQEASPDDASLRIMHAAHLHTKYIMLGHKLFADGVDDRAADEDRIEALVLSALPQVHAEPDLAIMAAKLLHFLDRGYGELALEIAEEAYGASLSVAASLPLIGQLRAYSGRIDEALPCIEQALHLVEPGSKSHLYALTIKCQILVASGNREGLGEAKRLLYAVSVLAPLFFEPMFGDPDSPSLRGRIAAMAMSRRMALACLLHTHYVSARLFSEQEHRDNVIRNQLALVCRRFGQDAVPQEIAGNYPGLVAHFG